jgi:glycosyltransferase involved in cell wall biosynthesis
MLEKAIIVSAHPDDEVLWFSSILEKVDDVVVCFLSNESNRWWSVGRRQSLLDHPIKNISCLNMDESDVFFNGADWQNPVVTEYGLEIADKTVPERIDKYKNNYDELKQRLEKQLDGYRNVYTHNPWGEYGHEEHVQVYRVIKGLQDKMRFNLWYSNYVSNKSFRLMLSHVDQFSFEYVVFETNKVLAREVKGIYTKNKCWTWFDDWEWFSEESFIKESVSQKEKQRQGRLFPTNLIRVGLPLGQTSKASYYSAIKRTMKTLAKEVFRKCGVEITRYAPSPYERVVSLAPEKTSKGQVLLSWLIEPFLLKPGEPIPNSHTQYWECLQMARTFLDLGYSVDVIDSWRNGTFEPKKRYSFFIGHRINFDRLTDLLNSDCVKIAHLDTAHWVFNNHSTYLRKFELQQRKGVTLKDSHRLVERNLAIENADYAVAYGNQFTLDTYRYANTPLFRVPISTCVLSPWPENKDYAACRSSFLWFGSAGFVHKGLDLVLEAFADMPEYHLYVCGPLEEEKDFVRVFYKELYLTPNIHTIGWVDVTGTEFMEIAGKCLGLIYPSCSEGGGGSVITCMHAGLIPIVSYESSVDVDDCGVVLKDNSINTLKNTVQTVSNLPSDQLRKMASNSRQYAATNHTREKFAAEYKKIILDIMEKVERRPIGL